MPVERKKRMQRRFSELEYAAKKKVTRRDRFLGEINAVTPFGTDGGSGTVLSQRRGTRAPADWAGTDGAYVYRSAMCWFVRGRC